MHRIIYALFFLTSLTFFSCTSGKKAFEQGDYYQAVIKSVSRLRQNPTHKKSRETLKQSYPLAVETYERNAVNAISADVDFKYREALRNYEKINRLYEEIRRSPGAMRIISNPVDHYTKVAQLKEQAAEESYEAGVLLLEKETRADAKDAYYRFKDVQSFVAEYKDVDEKLEEARFKATLKVVVEQIPVPTRYNLSAEFFQNKIEEYLHRPSRKHFFVRFYTPYEAESEQLPYVDHFLRLQFDDFAVGETRTEKVTESVSKDSVKVGTVELEDGSKRPVYSTVRAKVTTLTKSLRSHGLLNMEIIDGNTNAVLRNQKFNGEYTWTTQWGYFRGDERALTKEQLEVSKREERSPPPPQEMFIAFTEPIYRNLTRSISSFYASY